MFHIPSSKFHEKGIITPLILVITSILLIFAVALINWSVTEHKNAQKKIRTNQALQVAEAGVNYYKWHLEHDENNYRDGEDWCCDNDPGLSLADCGGVCGPYNHSYTDYSGDNIGHFSLKITPPEVGSTVVTVESTGYAYADADNEKKITAQLGKRSLAEYSFLSSAPIWIGSDESTSGPVHSNGINPDYSDGGIRFDGTCNAEVTSATESYDCADTPGHGCTGIKDGVWGSGGPSSYWRFPVPVVDFDLFSISLSAIQEKAAQEGGTCDGDSGEGRGICFGDSGAEGYLVKFNSNATIDIYRVDSLENKVWYRNYEQGGYKKEAEEIQDKTLLGNYNMPDNGLIFIGDDVWVEGIVNGKVTLAAAKFPENPNHYARIRINDNIQYVARDGNHNLGLISQGDLLVPRYTPDNLTIDATLLSQKGHVYHRIYWDDILCHYYGYTSLCRLRNNIEVYGGIITNLFWTWTWADGAGTSFAGYDNTLTIYNNNLTFSPPPSFPTSENFEVLSWEEN